MSTRIPSFLLGGINLTYNFIGTRTAQTTAFGVFETTLKLSPIALIFVAAGQSMKGSDAEALQVTIPDSAIPQRRSNLTQ